MARATNDATAWLDAHAALVVRRWATAAVAGRLDEKPTPNVVVTFCRRHRIPITDHRDTAPAILTRRNAIEAAERHAS